MGCLCCWKGLESPQQRLGSFETAILERKPLVRTWQHPMKDSDPLLGVSKRSKRIYEARMKPAKWLLIILTCMIMCQPAEGICYSA